MRQATIAVEQILTTPQLMVTDSVFSSVEDHVEKRRLPFNASSYHLQVISTMTRHLIGHGRELLTNSVPIESQSHRRPTV
ncbi:hypothetical protein TNCV_1755351 [Trichonephila clavipes]|nr:hypothetical protein TNCV_1755351 [Trichonephila clavipes]